MAKPAMQDEMLYCARCGISFLWSCEEQKQPGAVEPLRCPGCQRLMPAPHRERGQIKWFDRRKHYGFIVRIGQPEIYVHRSAVIGERLPRPGDLVEFGVEASARGPVAAEVTVVAPAHGDRQPE